MPAGRRPPPPHRRARPGPRLGEARRPGGQAVGEPGAPDPGSATTRRAQRRGPDGEARIYRGTGRPPRGGRRDRHRSNEKQGGGKPVSRDEVAVISAVRSPFGKFGGTLKDFTLPALGGLVFAEAVRRAGIEPSEVEEVATGVNLPGGDRSIARQVLIDAGIPTNRVAYTVDRACCSSMAAVNMASRSIRLAWAG